MTNKLLIYHFESATFDSYTSKLIENSSEELEYLQHPVEGYWTLTPDLTGDLRHTNKQVSGVSVRNSFRSISSSKYFLLSIRSIINQHSRLVE